ncbi:hypothetical protein DFR52_101323 [Hoeflea marina]|uniref:Cytochrome P450 n=1 Tax=Hoeflea marina TaxID=274592 RepID=A0A317PQ72_9HYPH|nr:hypothetical protein [Hoeflea marina]PWW03638.1 hypothetical protein DFR52_101323 [Hoeflea marina]
MIDSALQLVGLHHSPERRSQVFARPDSHFGFDPAMRCYATLTPEASLAIQQSEDWLAPDLTAFVERLVERLNLDLSVTVEVLGQVPLLHEGARHRELRRDLAGAISSRLPIVQREMPAWVSRLLEPMRHRDSFDLVSELSIPLIAAISRTLDGGITPPTEVAVSRLVDQLLGVGTRRSIETALKAMKAGIVGQSETEAIRALVLNVLGTDTLGGSLSATLHDCLPKQTPAGFAEISWPTEFTSTSIPYVARVAGRDCEVLGTSFSKGDNLHLYFLPFSDTEGHRDLGKLFGYGRHACIGKRLSLMVWNEVTRQLGLIDRKVVVTDYRLRPADYLFVYPEKLEIALS